MLCAKPMRTIAARTQKPWRPCPSFCLAELFSSYGIPAQPHVAVRISMASAPTRTFLLSLDNLKHALYVFRLTRYSSTDSNATHCTDGQANDKQHAGSGIAASWQLGPSWGLLQGPGSIRRVSSAAHEALEEVQSVEQLEKACWNCRHHMKRGSFACQGCERIQPVDPSLNYFELFGMPNMEFDLDLAKLERQYKLLQWNLHPDKVVRRTPQEQAFAAQQATLINHAYSILRSPLSRANYILSLKGIPAGETFEGTMHDKEFLLEVLEARETVDETEDVDELKEMLSANRSQQQVVVQQLSAALRSQHYDDAVQLATQLTYLARLEHEIVEKLPAR